MLKIIFYFWPTQRGLPDFSAFHRPPFPASLRCRSAGTVAPGRSGQRRQRCSSKSSAPGRPPHWSRRGSRPSRRRRGSWSEWRRSRSRTASSPPADQPPRGRGRPRRPCRSCSTSARSCRAHWSSQSTWTLRGRRRPAAGFHRETPAWPRLSPPGAWLRERWDQSLVMMRRSRRISGGDKK